MSGSLYSGTQGVASRLRAADAADAYYTYDLENDVVATGNGTAGYSMSLSNDIFDYCTFSLTGGGSAIADSITECPWAAYRVYYADGTEVSKSDWGDGSVAIAWDVQIQAISSSKSPMVCVGVGHFDSSSTSLVDATGVNEVLGGGIRGASSSSNYDPFYVTTGGSFAVTGSAPNARIIRGGYMPFMRPYYADNTRPFGSASFGLFESDIESVGFDYAYHSTDAIETRTNFADDWGLYLGFGFDGSSSGDFDFDVRVRALAYKIRPVISTSW